MSTLWNRSGTVERFGADDLRAAGAKAYFYQGGTTSPLTVFQDAAVNVEHPNPVVADATGRWPNVFVPFVDSYDVRVTTAEGAQLTYTAQIPNADPNPAVASTTKPAATLIQTGMIHGEFVDTVKVGFVRLNGRTIGNGSSSGTERANDDTAGLFSYLWGNLDNTIAPVSGGRGISAASDFAASKT